MIFYKYNRNLSCVVMVNGQPWPGTDEDGETCYENTHFTTEEKAWEHAKRDVNAGIKIKAMNLETAMGNLASAEKECGKMCIELRNFMKNYDSYLEKGKHEKT